MRKVAFIIVLSTMCTMVCLGQGISKDRKPIEYMETPEGPVEVTRDIPQYLGEYARLDYTTGQVRPLSYLRLWKDGSGEVYVDGGSAHSFFHPIGSVIKFKWGFLLDKTGVIITRESLTPGQQSAVHFIALRDDGKYRLSWTLEPWNGMIVLGGGAWKWKSFLETQ